eukprot:1158174-Pelagomonas_calceolata.AAC.4
MSKPAHLAHCRAHPRAMVVKTLDAVVVHATVVCARRLVQVAGVIVAGDDAVVVDNHLLGPV